MAADFEAEVIELRDCLLQLMSHGQRKADVALAAFRIAWLDILNALPPDMQQQAYLELFSMQSATYEFAKKSKWHPHDEIK